MNTESTDLPDCRFRLLAEQSEEGLAGLARFLAEDHSWYADLCELAFFNL